MDVFENCRDDIERKILRAVIENPGLQVRDLYHLLVQEDGHCHVYEIWRRLGWLEERKAIELLVEGFTPRDYRIWPGHGS